MGGEPHRSALRGPSAGYTVKVPGFEGPLDLLVTLAHQGRIDLGAISLADLTAEFLDRTTHALDLNEATEALWMLAALVEMKAKLLLPKPPPPEPLPETGASDLAERLEEKLGEYRAFQEAADALKALEEIQQRIFVRDPQADPADLLLEGLTVADLFQAFQAVLTRAREERAAEVADEPVRVADRMAAILATVRRSPGGIEFAALFPGRVTTVFVVVTFLALLELIKERLVRVQQASPLAPIRVMAAAGDMAG
ncbi:MAG: ScpA family protein [Armatimonadota bacterium]|nr:ScpA family protein [Armatimonadota bacterium]